MLQIGIGREKFRKGFKLSKCFLLYFTFKAIIKFYFAQTVFKYFPIIKFAKRQIMNTIAVVASWYLLCSEYIYFLLYTEKFRNPTFLLHLTARRSVGASVAF